jgi:hypothetical protein
MNSSRSDRDLVYVAQPDWWSRLVAIGSLAVAGTALYWSYLQDQQQSPRDIDQAAEIKTAVADGIQSIRDEGGRERQQLDSYLSSALTKIDQRVATRVAEQAPPQSSTTRFEEPIASPDDRPAAGIPPTEPEGDMLSSSPDDLDLAAPQAELIEVYAVLRVDDLETRPTLIVRNRGTAPARITHVRFEPTIDFDQVPLLVAGRDFGSTSPDRLVVRFTSADNLAANPDMHGAYERALDQPFEIAADQEVQIQVVIANRDHRGFGLRGRCLLLGDGGVEVAAFENVAVPFVTGS